VFVQSIIRCCFFVPLLLISRNIKKALIKMAQIKLPKNLVLLTLLVLAALSCKKDEDYRDDFTGNFTFTVMEEFWMVGQPTVYDTFNYDGTIRRYAAGDEEIDLCGDDTALIPSRSITIHFMDKILYNTNEGIIISEVTEDGLLVTKGGHHYYHYGEFIGEDSVSFAVENLGSLGGGWNYRIEGKKK
jgi:hypothetical protein